MDYDIAIIGGGPAGYTAAERAGENGLKTVLFEKNTLGGICLNEGCIPTKTLLYSAKLLDNIKHAARYGITADEAPVADLKKLMARKERTVKMLTGGVTASVRAAGADIIGAEAFIEGETDEWFLIKADKTLYRARYLMLCTGSDTLIPPIEGVGESGYWTSREALLMTELPRSIVIVGGGVIGMEFASFFNSMGVAVEVVEMMPEILGNMDREISALLRKEYTKRGVKFHLNTKVVKLQTDGVTIEADGKRTLLAADRHLLSVGRKANLTDFGLENLHAVTADKRGITVNEYLQTSHPRVYACGDVNGRSMLAHTAIREAEVAIHHILQEDDRMNYAPIPGVVYTNPEVAGVGVTEEEAKAQGIPHRIIRLPMAYSGRFVAENEQASGLCKLICDDGEHIIGCHLLGNPASELIVIAGIAIAQGATIESFRRTVFPHPTVGEIFHEAMHV
jgi:dihydrolipoamide dehydrogenase